MSIAESAIGAQRHSRTFRALLDCLPEDQAGVNGEVIRFAQVIAII